jgi:hypothetical protein
MNFSFPRSVETNSRWIIGAVTVGIFKTVSVGLFRVNGMTKNEDRTPHLNIYNLTYRLADLFHPSFKHIFLKNPQCEMETALMLSK